MKYSGFLNHFSENKPCPITEDELQLLTQFMPEQMILDAALHARYLTRLDLQNHRLNDDEIALVLKLIAGNPYVVFIDLSDNSIESISTERIEKVPNLFGLDLTGNELNQETFNELARCTSLTHLDFGAMPWPNLKDGHYLKDFITDLLNHPKLTYLRFATEVHTFFLNSLSALRTNTALKSLHVINDSTCSAGTISFDTINALSNNTHLQNITLEGFGFNTPNHQDALNAFAKMRLQVFGLKSPHATIYDLNLSAFYPQASISSLDISNNQSIDNDTLIGLADMPELRHFYIAELRRVTPYAIILIAQKNKLITFDISRNEMTMEAYDAVFAASHLRTLIADHTYYRPFGAATCYNGDRIANRMHTSTHSLAALSLMTQSISAAGVSLLFKSSTLTHLALNLSEFKLGDAQVLTECKASSLALKYNNADPFTFFRPLSTNSCVKRLSIDNAMSFSASLHTVFGQNRHLVRLKANHVLNMKQDTVIYMNRYYRPIMFNMLLALAPLAMHELALKIIFSYVFDRDLTVGKDPLLIASFSKSINNMRHRRKEKTAMASTSSTMSP